MRQFPIASMQMLSDSQGTYFTIFSLAERLKHLLSCEYCK